MKGNTGTMTLKSMRLSIKKAKEYIGLSQAPTTVKEENRYPYGLRLDLDSNALGKLGIKMTDWNFGDKVEISGKAKIVRMGSHESWDGKNEAIELQITDLALK